MLVSHPILTHRVRAFAGRIPGATLTVHDEWAHMSPFVDPAACARMMSDAVQP